MRILCILLLETVDVRAEKKVYIAPKIFSVKLHRTVLISFPPVDSVRLNKNFDSHHVHSQKKKI